MAKEITEGKGLLEYIERENLDLNLFAAYTKIDFASISPEEFVEGYKLLQNTYYQYLEEYCQGDNTQVDEGKYANYFKNALQFEEKIGESGFISTIQALIQQNHLNGRYYEEYGKDMTKTQVENDFMKRLMDSVMTMFDGQRREEYNTTIEGIEDLYASLEINELQNIDHSTAVAEITGESFVEGLELPDNEAEAESDWEIG